MTDAVVLEPTPIQDITTTIDRRLQTIAQNALVEAYKTVGFNVPLVVRLEGTEVDQGAEIEGDGGREMGDGGAIFATRAPLALASWTATWSTPPVPPWTSTC